MKRLALVLLLAACTKDASSAPSGSRIAIDVTEDGFAPDHIKVDKDKAVTLVFDRKTDQTCAKKVVVDTGADKITKDLPLNKEVEIPVTFAKAGELKYACAMNMISGTISVE